jgi:Protein of unknown function (DUF3570)
MNQSKSTSLLAISSVACLLPGIANTANAAIDPKWQLSYQYSQYAEDNLPQNKLLSGTEERYKVNTNLLNLRAPIDDSAEVNITVLSETMSGASPWYVQPSGDELLQVMSGATISEQREEISLDFHNTFKQSDLYISLGHSTENDYQSFSGGVSGSFRLASYLTIDCGISFSNDFVDASGRDDYPDRPTEESRNKLGVFSGFSYALTKTTLFSYTASYAVLEGYLSDPYKLALIGNATVQDSRPDSNTQFTNTLKIRQFIPAANAALHIDYRYFISNWIYENANTLNIAWHQNFGDSWKIIPSFRYYNQSAAYFYQPYYTDLRADGFYSSDYRLSEFDATSGQLKIAKNFSSFAISLSHEVYKAKGQHPGLIEYSFSTFGLVMSF